MSLHSMPLRIVVAASAIAAAIGCARADAAQPAPAPSAVPTIAIVVTSDRQREPLSIVARTTYVVTKSDMIAHGDATIADALARLPGIVVERSGGAGSLADVFIRGTSTNQTLVLLDGLPLAGAASGTLDLGSYATAGVERIEVVEGGGHALYGAGAVGGVIDIITSGIRPDASVGFGTYGHESLTYESPNVTFSRSLARDDYAFPAQDAGIPPVAGRSNVWENGDSEVTTLRLRDAQRHGSFTIGETLDARSEHLGTPGSVSSAESLAREDVSADDATVSIARAHANGTATLDLTGGTIRQEYSAPPNDPNGAFDALTTEGRLQASLRDTVAAGRDRIVYGADLARGVARVDAGFGAVATQGFAQTSLYVQDAREIAPAVRIYGGMRAERDGGIGGALVPSLGGIVRLGESALRANWARSYRVPTEVDLYYPGFSNPNLHPERAQTFDLSLDQPVRGGTVTIGYFSIASQDLIEVNPNVDYTQPADTPANPGVINVARASIAGFTLDARTVRGGGIAATAGITDTYRALDLTAIAMRLPRRPVFSTNLGLDYRAPVPSRFLEAGIDARSAGARDAFADPYTVVDTFARFRLARRAIVTVRVRNLGNDRYQDVAGYPAPGRSLDLVFSTR